jgi:signal transduction histidine kinase
MRFSDDNTQAQIDGYQPVLAGSPHLNYGNEINLAENKDKLLEAIAFSAEMFLKTKDFGAAINEVFKKLGGALRLHQLAYAECDAATESKVRIIKTYQWNSHNSSDNGVIKEHKEMLFSNCGIERWYRHFRIGRSIYGNVNNFPQPENKFFLIKNAKSAYILPVLLNNYFCGFLCFSDHKITRQWSKGEKDALRAIGKILAAELQRVNYDEKLVRAKEEAERGNLFKSRFLEQMSHEIRTPLNTILSFISLIKSELDGVNGGIFGSWYGMIDSSSKRLIRTIDMILTMSQLQAGNYEFLPEVFDLSDEFLPQIFREFEILAKEKNIAYELEIEPGPAIVFADKHTVSHILLNLIENAFKFTKKGTVKIKLSGTPCSFLIIDIIDTGVGISEEYFPDLFTPFSQEQMGIKRSYEGNGLGLALVKRYIEMNKAKITVQSKKNEGSVFSVIFSKYDENEQ